MPAPSKPQKPVPALENQTSVPRLVCDSRGQILHANAAFAELAGKNAANVTGKTLLDILNFQDPEDVFRGAWLFGDKKEGADDFLTALNAGEHPVSFAKQGQTVLLHFDWADMADGRRFLIVSTAGEHTEPDEQVRTLLQKIQPQKKDIKYFDAEDTALNHFLDMSHEVLCQLDENGAFTWTNDTFCATLKTDGSILNKKTFLNIVHPDDKAQVRHIFSDMAYNDAEGKIIDFECRMIASDGEILSFEWRQKIVGQQTYCVGHDLTAIKNHEAALTRQKQRLHEAEAIGKIGHWTWTLGEESFSWSDEIYRIFGVDRQTFVPSLDTVNALVHKGDVGRILQVFQRAMIENKDYEMDFRINRPSGAVCYVRCQGRCETDSDGDVIALYGIMQDITSDTLHEQDLRKAKDAAEAAYAAKSRFLANMSHELRTPLNAIIGFSEMIQNQLLGPLGNDRYLEYIAGIRESGTHLLDLISDILDMSKIEAGKYQLDLEKFSIAKVIRMSVHMMEGRAIDSSIKITTDIENENTKIIGDRRALMQMMLNLLSNAVKFSNSESTIKVECHEKENGVKIKVIDEGIGIPAHKIHSITNPFEQVSSHYTREHEGSGLGLAITKELVEMHGGSLHIDSEIGRGTTVTMTLPSDASKFRKKAKAQIAAE